MHLAPVSRIAKHYLTYGKGSAGNRALRSDSDYTLPYIFLLIEGNVIMADSRITKQVLKLAFLAQTPEELGEKLKQTDAVFTDDEVKTLFERVKQDKKVALLDDNLEEVAGCCGSSSSNDYS